MPDKGDQNLSSSRAREREAGGAWQRMLDALPKDDQGRRMIGSPDDGCRHCGRHIETVPEGLNVVVYHPALECCAGAVLDRLGPLLAEMGALKEQFKRDQLPATGRLLLQLDEQRQRLRFLLQFYERNQ